MAKREVFGVMVCPECGHDAAEVKPQKSGLAYRWCPECNAQYFTRCETTSGRLLAKIGKAAPVTDTDTKAGITGNTRAEPATAGRAEIDPPAVVPPKKKGTGNALLDLIQGNA